MMATKGGRVCFLQEYGVEEFWPNTSNTNVHMQSTNLTQVSHEEEKEMEDMVEENDDGEGEENVVVEEEKEVEK